MVVVGGTSYTYQYSGVVSEKQHWNFLVLLDMRTAQLYSWAAVAMSSHSGRAPLSN